MKDYMNKIAAAFCIFSPNHIFFAVLTQRRFRCIIIIYVVETKFPQLGESRKTRSGIHIFQGSLSRPKLCFGKRREVLII